MQQLESLSKDVEAARKRYLQAVESLSPEQARFKPAQDVWSAVENTEHIARAEQGGIWGMWVALEGFLQGTPAWTGESPHRGKSIEQIVAETWKPKEQVPATAAPVWGGSLAYWISALRANESLLAALTRAVEGYDLDEIQYPHPISGPLNLRQRYQFLRFHLDRHREQVEALTRHDSFPSAAAAATSNL